MNARIGTPSALNPLLGLRERENGEEDVVPAAFHRVASHEQTHALDSGEGLTGLLVSTYNLTSTILGAGILSIPFALAECGVALGVALLAFTAMASIASCNLVLSCYLRTGRGSYGDLALDLFGHRFSVVVKWIIIVLNTGAAAGYMLVIKSLLPPSLCQLIGDEAFFCSHKSGDAILTGIIVFGVIFPLCTLKNLSSLRHTSMLAFLFAVFLTVAITVRSIEHSDEYCDVQLLPRNAMGMFKAVPVFCFSFVCHLNVLPVYDQLHSRTPTKMRSVFRNAIFFAMVLYCFAGTFGYLRFNCGKVPDNILQFGFFASDDILISAARIAEALTCTLALPLIQHPTRVALHSWIFDEKQESDSEQDPVVVVAETRDLVQSENGYGLLPVNEDGEEEEAGNETVPTTGCENTTPTRMYHKFPFERHLEALGVLSIAFSLALLFPNISMVFGLLGATCCSMVCFILPGTFYLAATKSILVQFPWERPYSTKDRDALVRVQNQRRLSWVMILFGSVVAVLGTIATLL